MRVGTVTAGTAVRPRTTAAEFLDWTTDLVTRLNRVRSWGVAVANATAAGGRV